MQENWETECLGRLQKSQQQYHYWQVVIIKLRCTLIIATGLHFKPVLVFCGYATKFYQYTFHILNTYK